MARGKHATSAEARRAREAAETEVVALRRRIEKVTKERDAAVSALAAERADAIERLRHAHALAEEGSSHVVEALRAEIVDMKEAAEVERLERARRVMEVIGNKPWVNVAERTDSRLAEALRVQVGDLYAIGMVAPTRRQRRMTNRLANLNRDLLREASSGVLAGS